MLSPYIFPVLLLFLLIFVVLAFGLVFIKSVNFSRVYPVLEKIVILGLFFACFLNIWLFVWQNETAEVYTLFNFLFKIDGFTLFSQSFLLLLSPSFLIFSRRFIINSELASFEFLILFLLFLSGALLLVAANDFISLYLCLELQTIPLYLLIGLSKKSKLNLEAALKYFLLSILSSAILLLGVGFIYYVSGCFNFSDLFLFNSLGSLTIFVWGTQYNFFFIVYCIGFMCIISSFFFKLAAAPFHFWTPDVYVGAPIPITFLLSTLSKFSIFVAFVHVVFGAFAPFYTLWSFLLLVIGILSLAVGVIGAFYYNAVGRIVAFGSTAHIGFVLLALCAFGGDAIFLALVYFFSYLLASFLFFGIWLNVKLGSHPIFVGDFIGLFYVSRIYACLMVLGLFSLAGIPPLVGFIAKFLVLKGLLLGYGAGVSLFVFLLSVLSAVYYLRITKFILFGEPKHEVKFMVNLSLTVLIHLMVFASLLLLTSPIVYL